VTVEVETKLAVPSLEQVRMKLQSLDAEKIMAGLEINTLFDRPDGSLQCADAAVRIRSCTDHTGQQIDTMTYKGPVQPGAVKRRREIEFTVSDPAAAANFLQAIELHPVFTFEKRRERWALNHCFVDLDQLPEIGTFVEIEGLTEAAIAAVQRTLQLDGINHISESYPRLLGRFDPGRTGFRFPQPHPHSDCSVTGPQ
jgi:predicted adenylyl cyclase CyaB